MTLPRPSIAWTASPGKRGCAVDRRSGSWTAFSGRSSRFWRSAPLQFRTFSCSPRGCAVTCRKGFQPGPEATRKTDERQELSLDDPDLCCASDDGLRNSHQRSAAQRSKSSMSARDPRSVEVFATRRPSRPYVEVAMLEAQQASVYSTDSAEEVMGKLREYAAKKGCDAIIIGGPNDATVGGGFCEQRRRKQLRDDAQRLSRDVRRLHRRGSYGGRGEVTVRSPLGPRATCPARLDRMLGFGWFSGRFRPGCRSRFPPSACVGPPSIPRSRRFDSAGGGRKCSGPSRSSFVEGTGCWTQGCGCRKPRQPGPACPLGVPRRETCRNDDPA